MLWIKAIHLRDNTNCDPEIWSIHFPFIFLLLQRASTSKCKHCFNQHQRHHSAAWFVWLQQHATQAAQLFMLSDMKLRGFLPFAPLNLKCLITDWKKWRWAFRHGATKYIQIKLCFTFWLHPDKQDYRQKSWQSQSKQELVPVTVLINLSVQEVQFGPLME